MRGIIARSCQSLNRQRRVRSLPLSNRIDLRSSLSLRSFATQPKTAKGKRERKDNKSDTPGVISAARFEHEKELPHLPFTKNPIKDLPKMPLNTRIEKYQDVYTETSEISNHTAQDIGRYFLLSDGKKTVPSCLLPQMEEELDLTGNYMMIRREGWNLVQALKQIDGKEQDGMSFGVVGNAGRGKSGVVHYAVQYAREKNWLIIPITAQDLYDDQPGFIEKNTARQTLAQRAVYDQPSGTKRFLRSLRDSEVKRLSQIKLKKEYNNFTWAPELKGADGKVADALRPSTDPDTPKTLFDLVALGALDLSQSSDCLWALIEELRNTTEMPVMIVMENYNRFDNESDFIYPENPKRRIPNRQLGLVAAFMTFSREPPKYGATVFATTSGSTLRHTMEHLDAATKVEVGRLYPKEVDNAIWHYKASGKILASPQEITDNFKAKIRVLSQGIFRDVSFLAGLH